MKPNNKQQKTKGQQVDGMAAASGSVAAVKLSHYVCSKTRVGGAKSRGFKIYSMQISNEAIITSFMYYPSSLSWWSNTIVPYRQLSTRSVSVCSHTDLFFVTASTK
jgi:hypothetical protein